jgi:para-aminobenzoate synthetase component I
MNITEFTMQANAYGSQKQPFFFLIDFELNMPFICPYEEATKYDIRFDVRGQRNFSENPAQSRTEYKIQAIPIDISNYEQAFNLVKKNLQDGNSYLLNLTFPTILDTDMTLVEIFQNSYALYKLLYKDEFIINSPECFVQTRHNHIYSYPMKGTIDAAIVNAKQNILANKKETWEHNTIVDLIRNDLAMVSENIMVTKFRYIEKIKTDRIELLQVSSEIRGELNENWRSQIGSMMIKMLPAGSISGAPKKKTIEIIRQAEKQDRGYYTGIFGIFDGTDIDSAVNIRYIEKTDIGLQYRSGGGVTAMSDMKYEYQELLDKVYVPID